MGIQIGKRQFLDLPYGFFTYVFNALVSDAVIDDA